MSKNVQMSSIDAPDYHYSNDILDTSGELVHQEFDRRVEQQNGSEVEYEKAVIRREKPQAGTTTLRVGESRKPINREMDEKFRDIERRMDDSFRDMNSTMEQSVRELESTTAPRDLGSSFRETSKGRDAGRSIDDSMRRVEDDMDRSMRQMDQEMENVGRSIDHSMRRVEDDMDQNIRQMDQRMQRLEVEINDSFKDFNGKMRDMEASVATELEKTRQEMDQLSSRMDRSFR